LHVKQAL